MKKKKKKKSKLLTKKYIDIYLNKNVDKAIRKLKNMKNNGSYKASEKAQQAYSQMRMLYRKYGLDENVFHKGQKFREQLRSLNDLNVFYRSIKQILEINARVETRKYHKLQEEYKKKKVDFDENFNILSMLSSEFHEVFAFLSYNDVQDMLISTENDYKNVNTVDDILKLYKETIADKELTDTQKYKSSQLNKKIITKVNAKSLRYIMGK